MQDSWLPESISTAENKATGNRILSIYGEVFGSFIDSYFKSVNLNNWLWDIKHLRQNYKANPIDIHFLLGDILKYSDSPLRRPLPRNDKFYKNIELIFKFRNLTSHSNYDGNLAELKSVIYAMDQSISSLGLVKDVLVFKGISSRLEEIESGKYLPTQILQNAQIAELEVRYAQNEDLLTDLKNQLETSENLTESMSLELDSLRAKIREKESQILQKDELVKLQELVLKSEKQADLEKIKWQKINEKMEEQDFRLKNLTEVMKLIPEILEGFQGKDSRLSEKKSKTTMSPGAIWRGDRGKTRLTLSPSKRCLIDVKTNEVLRDDEYENLQEVINDWLEIRPTGGRVFIDNDNHATTMIGENLIYLGMLFSS